LKFYKNTTMKVRPSVGSSRIGVKDEREKDDFSTHFPRVFHTFSTVEKPEFIMVLVSFPQKSVFPFFFNREVEYPEGTFMIYFRYFKVQVFYFYLFSSMIFYLF
jgi:hypothetical protein